MIWFSTSVTFAISVLCLGPIVFLLFEARHFFAFSDPLFKALLVTLQTGIGSGLLSVSLGLIFAKIFTQYLWKGQRFQRLLLVIPYLTPNFILAMSFVLSWNPTTGLANGLIPFPGSLYGSWGMTVLFAITHMPIAFLILEDKYKRLDASLIEAARLSGASLTRIFFQIEIPLLRTTILSAIGICFSLSISAFAIPAWLGAPARSYTLTYKIYETIQMGGLDGISDASQISVVLFALGFIPFIIEMLFNRKTIATLSPKQMRRLGLKFQKRRLVAFQIFFYLIAVWFWVLPLIILTLSTLVPPGCFQSEGLTCLSQFSFSKYLYVLFELQETKQALLTSLQYGGIASVLILFLGILSLWASTTHRFLKSVLDFVINTPLATPGAIIALGLIVTLSGRFSLNLYNTAWMAVLAYVIKHLALAYQPLVTGYSNISPTLKEAALLCGATRRQVWTKITLPLLRPEIFGGLFLVFIPILGELTMSVFLASPQFRSLGTVLFDLQDYADSAAASALAVLMVIFILILNRTAKILSQGKLGY